MKSVLILDDDAAVRESLMDFFEDREWRVLPACSAEEALAELEYEAPHGAVVDIRLPGMDGNAFILEAARKCPAMACVIVTGSPEYRPPEDVVETSEVSASVFAKPVTDLISLEEALLRKIKKSRAGAAGDLA